MLAGSPSKLIGHTYSMIDLNFTTSMFENLQDSPDGKHTRLFDGSLPLLAHTDGYLQIVAFKSLKEKTQAIPGELGEMQHVDGMQIKRLMRALYFCQKPKEGT